MMGAVLFQGPAFLKVGGSLGPHSIILDPSLEKYTNVFQTRYLNLYLYITIRD